MPTEKKFPAPQGYEEGACPDIPMTIVESSQVACIGYCENTGTLAVQFRHGAGAIYHYKAPRETFDAFMASESKGNFFKANIKALAFKKYPSPKGDGLQDPPGADPKPEGEKAEA